MKINDQAKKGKYQCKIVGFNADKTIYNVVYANDKNNIVSEKAEDLEPLFVNLKSESLKRTSEHLGKDYNLIDPFDFANDYDINFIEERFTMDKKQIITYKDDVIWTQGN